MPTRLSLQRSGDDLLEIAVSSAEQARLLAQEISGFGLCEDIVPGMRSLSLRSHPSQMAALEKALSALSLPPEDVPHTGAMLAIEIQYGGPGGPDLPDICRTLDISKTTFIDRHTAATYTVDLIGFTPGFTYLTGLDSRLSVPRLATPRPRLRAGSVGISAAYTGIYALPGPGGWPIIGQTNMSLFEAEAVPPFRLQPGMRVRFKAV